MCFTKKDTFDTSFKDEFFSKLGKEYMQGTKAWWIITTF